MGDSFISIKPVFPLPRPAGEAPSPGSHGSFDLALVASWRQLRGASACEYLGSAGGFSGARFWRIRAAEAAYALRRWPQGAPDRRRLKLIHAALRQTVEAGVRELTLPLDTLDGKSFVSHAGHLWQLEPWSAGETYSAAPSTARLSAAFRWLASYHAAAESLPEYSPRRVPRSIEDRLQRLSAFDGGGLREIARSLGRAGWPETDSLAPRVLQLAEPRIRPALARLSAVAGNYPQLPALRDIWSEHVLFDGEEVAAVIDFGSLDVDTPATDIARLAGSMCWDQQDDWSLALDAYQRVRPLSANQRDLVAVLDAANVVLAGLNWLRWIYVEGRQFENREAVAARLKAALQRLESQE